MCICRQSSSHQLHLHVSPRSFLCGMWVVHTDDERANLQILVCCSLQQHNCGSSILVLRLLSWHPLDLEWAPGNDLLSLSWGGENIEALGWRLCEDRGSECQDGGGDECVTHFGSVWLGILFVKIDKERGEYEDSNGEL